MTNGISTVIHQHDAECEQMIAHFTKSTGFVQEYPHAAISAEHIKAAIFLTSPLVKDRGQPDLAKEPNPISLELMWKVYMRDYFAGYEGHQNIQQFKQAFLSKFNQ